MDWIVQVVNDYGFAVLLSLGMGFFIYYVWRYVTEKLELIIDELTHEDDKTDRSSANVVQDQIRLKQKTRNCS